MRSCLHGLFLLALSLASAGCAGPSTPAPAGDEVIKAQISVRQAPPGSGLKVPCAATLTEGPDLDELRAWLKEMDWSQKGIDLAVVRMAQPDGEMILTMKDGSALGLDFSWNGNLVKRRANRLYQGANGAKFQKIVERTCK